MGADAVLPGEPAAEKVAAGVGEGAPGAGVIIGTTMTALSVPITMCDLLGVITASCTPSAVATPMSCPPPIRAVAQVVAASTGQTSEMFEVVISRSPPPPT